MSDLKMYDNLEDMLWDISQILADDDIEEDTRFLIEPVDDPMRLELGFRHVETGQEWRIGLKHLKGSTCPYKRVLAPIEGREQMAVGMGGFGLLKPEDILRIDVERTRQSEFWEFDNE